MLESRVACIDFWTWFWRWSWRPGWVGDFLPMFLFFFTCFACFQKTKDLYRASRCIPLNKQNCKQQQEVRRKLGGGWDLELVGEETRMAIVGLPVSCPGARGRELFKLFWVW